MNLSDDKRESGSLLDGSGLAFYSQFVGQAQAFLCNSRQRSFYFASITLSIVPFHLQIG